MEYNQKSPFCLHPHQRNVIMQMSTKEILLMNTKEILLMSTKEILLMRTKEILLPLNMIRI